MGVAVPEWSSYRTQQRNSQPLPLPFPLEAHPLAPPPERPLTGMLRDATRKEARLDSTNREAFALLEIHVLPGHDHGNLQENMCIWARLANEVTSSSNRYNDILP